MYTLLYAMYASKNNMGTLKYLKKILNEGHTHASRVARTAMQTFISSDSRFHGFILRDHELRTFAKRHKQRSRYRLESHN